MPVVDTNVLRHWLCRSLFTILEAVRVKVQRGNVQTHLGQMPRGPMLARWYGVIILRNQPRVLRP